MDAVSTRAVAAAAGVQPPTIYRQFGDKEGLLDARIADYGRLRMSVKRATELMHAAALGYAVSQIRVSPEERDPQLSEIVCQNAIAGIITEGEQWSTLSDLPGRAVALREAVGANADGALTPAERTLMAEWLDRLADRAD